MDWVKRLNQAIEFIEENLDGELALDFLEKDIWKRIGQWRMVYLKESND